jgi:putative sigma-54 modulation protein
MGAAPTPEERTMEVTVRMHGLDPSAAFAAYARSRVRIALARFHPEVREVEVVVSDVNGPRGGADLRCRIVARVRRAASLVAEALAGDAYAALDVAVGRLERATGRVADRRAAPRRAPRVVWGLA